MNAGRLLDSAGRPFALGAELARGGEGAVFDVAGRPESAAKIYLHPPDQAKGEKIAAMVAMANERLTALCAWPTATLHRPGGAVAGFVMPKLAGYRPVFQVYGPKLRLRQFPKADWRFLVHTGGNVARAFAAVHAMGLVVGDVNQNSLFVATDATVRFIDTDSMQVTRRGRVWRCEVGVSTHQPPEMQGLDSYRDVTRTPNHDAFGLAVMVFQLLCLGRHPFAGRYSGRGEPPGIDEAIAQGRYAYAADTRRTQMTPPLGSLPISALPKGVRALFEAAFAPDAARAGRPTADQWASELAALGKSLRRCGTNGGHWYAEAAGSCPWCQVEGSSGVALFPAVFVTGQAGGGVLLLWQQIAALAEPPALPPLVRPKAGSVPPASRIAKLARRRRRRFLLMVAAAVVMAALMAAWPSAIGLLSLVTVAVLAAGGWWLRPPPEAASVRAALAEAATLWADLERRWAPGPATRFAAARQALAELKREHDTLPARRAQELRGASSDRRRQQLRAHLENFDIAGAKVPGVGRAKVGALVSYGVETAADIEASRIEAIPGFGPKTAAALLAFRRACEASFRFDETGRAASAHVAALDGMLEQRRAKIEGELAAGLAQLRAMAEGERRHRAALEQRAAELTPAYAQALANARALGVT